MKIRFKSLIHSTSLNKMIFKFLCLSIISVLSCTKLMRAVFKSNLSLFWIGHDYGNSDECRDLYQPNVEHLYSRWDICKQHCYHQFKYVQLSFHMFSLFCQGNWHHSQEKKWNSILLTSCWILNLMEQVLTQLYWIFCK